ncbi:unnamed protein product [Auanema sp. JU1783]|nr:unnamed protein product [Auanema sp. JU1783]
MATVQNDVMAGGSVKNIVDRFSRDFSSSKPPISVSDGSKKALAPKPSTNPLVVVTFQYAATQPDELSLNLGDIIEILEELEEGWAKGRIQRSGEIGAFPTNFVETKNSPVASSAPPIAKEEVVTRRTISEEKPEAIKRTPSVVLPNSSLPVAPVKKDDHKEEKTKEMARIKFVYEPQNPDELHLDEIGALIEIIRKDCGDVGWFEGEMNGRKGLFPDNFVELVTMPVACKSGSPKASNVTKFERPMKAPLVPPTDATIAPPAVPAKPSKTKLAETNQFMNSSAPPAPASSTKPVSSNFADIRSKLAQGLKVVAPGDAVHSVLSKSTIVSSGSYSEPSGPNLRPLSTIEQARYEDKDEASQLNHITKDRPRPPGKRPMSVLVQKKRQSNDNVLDSPSDVASPVSSNQITSSEVISSSAKSPAAMMPSSRDDSKKEDPPLSTKSSSSLSFSVRDRSFGNTSSVDSSPYKGNVGGSGDSDYVSRKEYNELQAKVTALENRLAQLERNNR